MLIDVHGHFGQRIAGVAPPARISTYAGVCGADLVLVSNRDAASEPAGAANLDEAEANLACLSACREHSHLVPLYWVRPGLADSNVNALAGALLTEPFAGVVFAPTDNGYDVADPRLGPYLALLAKVGRPVLFCIGADERTAPHKIHDRGRRYPSLPIVLCPCGAPAGQRAAALDAVRYAIQRNDAQLYLDTSHADADEVCTAVRTVGAERVLFGSNAVHYGESHIPRHIALLEELRAALVPEEFQQVAGGSAARLFGLSPQAGG